MLQLPQLQGDRMPLIICILVTLVAATLSLRYSLENNK